MLLEEWKRSTVRLKKHKGLKLGSRTDGILLLIEGKIRHVKLKPSDLLKRLDDKCSAYPLEISISHIDVSCEILRGSLCCAGLSENMQTVIQCVFYQVWWINLLCIICDSEGCGMWWRSEILLRHRVRLTFVGADVWDVTVKVWNKVYARQRQGTSSGQNNNRKNLWRYDLFHLLIFASLFTKYLNLLR